MAAASSAGTPTRAPVEASRPLGELPATTAATLELTGHSLELARDAQRRRSVTQVATDLSLDCRRSECCKRHAPTRVEAVAGADQPEGADLH